MVRETNFAKMYVQNGIFFLEYKPIDLNMEVARIIVRERIEFMDGKIYPCLFNIINMTNSSKEARDYMADEGNDLVLASAILINSPVLRMMANFYIMVNKPKNPTRMYTNQQEAIEWLKQYKILV